MTGPVFAPGESGYADEITGFNLAIVHTPSLVVGVETAADVAASVQFARVQGLPVSVQSTGHADQAVTAGLMISTRRLDGVSIDPSEKTAKVGAGARWAAVVAAAVPHGLFPVTGSAPGVGVVGYLLGGGIGPLVRSHGFSSDYLTGLTVVTGQGEALDVSADQHADLFWALRGGKSGLGIVTEARIKLVDLNTIYAGSLFFEDGQLETVFRAWIDWTASADQCVSTSVAIMQFPDLPIVPEPVRGRCLLNLRFAFPGVAEEGIRLAAPLRAAAPIYLDLLNEIDWRRDRADPQ